MRQTRRAILAAAGSFFVAGCLGNGTSEANSSSEPTEPEQEQQQKQEEDPNKPIAEFSNSDVVQSSVDDLQITDHEFAKESQGADVQNGQVVLSDAIVQGTVENTATEDAYQNVTVALTLLDANRNTIGLSDDWVDVIEAGQTWTFEIVPDVDTTFDDVETYRLEVDGETDMRRVEEGVRDAVQD